MCYDTARSSLLVNWNTLNRSSIGTIRMPKDGKSPSSTSIYTCATVLKRSITTSPPFNVLKWPISDFTCARMCAHSHACIMLSVIIGVTFPNRLGGRGQSVKSARCTIKILPKSDLSSDLTHFLATIGGARALPKRYKATPMSVIIT